MTMENYKSSHFDIEFYPVPYLLKLGFEVEKILCVWQVRMSEKKKTWAGDGL